MWEQILPWIGGIFAGLGVIFLFFDIINCIIRRNGRALNIVGLVVLSIGVVGYVLTDIVFKDSAWPPFASLIWIALFWIYVILVGIEAVNATQDYKRAKREAERRARREANIAVMNVLHEQRDKKRAKITDRKAREKARKAERKAREKAQIAERKARQKAKLQEAKAKQKAKHAEQKANEKARIADRKAKERTRTAQRKAKQKAKNAESVAWQEVVENTPKNQ